jgi:hypothetical protein
MYHVVHLYCSKIVWSKYKPCNVYLVCSSFIVHFLFVMYSCWCIVFNNCMMMHPGDMLDGTIVSVCAVIAHGGVTSDGDR